MAQVRVNLIFKIGEGGWMETYYDIAANNPKAAITNANQPAGLAPMRAQLLAEDASLYAIRASDDLVLRDSEVLFFTQPQNGKLSETAPEFVSLTLRLAAGAFNRRALYMRGIPQRIISADGTTYFPNADFHGRLQAFLAMLVGPNSTYGMKVLSVAPPRSAVVDAIRLPGSDFGWQFETLNPIDVNPGDMIRIRGGKKGNDLKGYARVTQGGNPFKLEYTRWRAGPLTANTSAQRIQYTLATFTSGQVTDINHRDTGRFLFQHAGRRKGH